MSDVSVPRNSLQIIGQDLLPAYGDAPAGSVEAEETRKFRPDIYWYLSFRCNLACEHCSVFSSPFVDTSQDLDTESALNVVDQMVELNVRTAILSGGEVLFRPDALEIMQACFDRGLRVSLETNGLLISDDLIAFAKAAQEKRLFNMCVSVDGGTPETHDAMRGPNTFKTILANLKKLHDGGIRFDIQCILNKANMATIPDFYRWGRDLQPGLRNILFGFLNPVGRGSELIKKVGLGYEDMIEIMKLVRSAREGFPGQTVVKAAPAAIPPQFVGMVYNSPNTAGCMTCQFPLLGVLPNGDVTICAVSRDNEELCFGNVRNRRLKDIWLETRMDMLRSRYVEAEHLQGICGDCVWQSSCKGSCRAWAYEHGSSFDAPFPLCEAMVEAGSFPNAYRISKQRDLAVEQGIIPPADSLLGHRLNDSEAME